MRAGESYLANKFQTFLITCLESVLLVFIGTGSIQAQNVTYSGNLQFATGSYFFTERTESIYFTNSFSLSGDYMRVSLSIPYVIQSTPWISYSPGGGIPTTGKSFKDGEWLVSASFFGSTKMIDDFDPPVSLNIGLGHFISSRVSFSGSVSFGLTESSPDFSAGAGWGIRL